MMGEGWILDVFRLHWYKKSVSLVMSQSRWGKMHIQLRWCHLWETSNHWNWCLGKKLNKTNKQTKNTFTKRRNKEKLNNPIKEGVRRKYARKKYIFSIISYTGLMRSKNKSYSSKATQVFFVQSQIIFTFTKSVSLVVYYLLTSDQPSQPPLCHSFIP